MWQQLDAEVQGKLEFIAYKQADVTTLATRGSDRLDFKDLSVATIRELMAQAFIAGRSHEINLMKNQ
jgi:hypothetical protein